VSFWAFFPHFGVVLHLDEPSREGVRDYWASGIFFCSAVFLALGCRAIIWTREMLASLFILNLAAYVDSLRPRP
jgi:hypothetical protein